VKRINEMNRLDNNIRVVPIKAKSNIDQPHFSRKSRIRKLLSRFKKLKGDPHYVGMGMAIGVFVSLTPTIPFHTILAVLLAFILRGSKPAAMIGVWLCNPLTIPFFYLASYKVGSYIVDSPLPFDQKYDSILELLKMGMNTTLAMTAGGVIIGILPALAAYVITKNIFVKIHLKKTRFKRTPSPTHTKSVDGKRVTSMIEY